MKFFSSYKLKESSPEHLSMFVLYVLVALVVLAFGAFFLIGFNIPFDEDPSFNAPMLTDMVLVLMYLFVLATIAITVWSVIRQMQSRGKSSDMVNNIPASKITKGTIALLLLCLVVTFIFGSTDPVMVNGGRFDSFFWLKATDMFLNTALILLVVAVAGVVFGLSGYSRRLKQKR